jgi:hypothetical protein
MVGDGSLGVVITGIVGSAELQVGGSDGVFQEVPPMPVRPGSVDHVLVCRLIGGASVHLERVETLSGSAFMMS